MEMNLSELTSFQRALLLKWGEKFGKNHHVQKETILKKLKTPVKIDQFKKLISRGFIRRYKTQKRTDFCMTNMGWKAYLTLKKRQ